MIVSALLKRPIVWQISKVETHSPQGLSELTLYQDKFNESTDYVNLETGEMYADYYISSAAVTQKTDITEIEDGNVICNLTSSTDQIKVGGSYKMITANFIDSDGNDVTSEYLDLLSPDCWTFYIDGENVTETDIVSTMEQSSANMIKIKFSNNRNYLAKTLIVKCEIGNTVGEIQLGIVGL